MGGGRQFKASRSCPRFPCYNPFQEFAMADLFQILPAALFRPLAAPGAAIYSQILLALLAETQQHQQPLSRELAQRIVTDGLAQPDALTLTRDAIEATNTTEPEDTQSRASAILRYLTQCGWLRGETQSDFTSTYIFPDYAFRLLQTLREISANEPPPLQGLIYSIYALLQTGLREGNLEDCIPEAHRQMLHLLNGLKELQHNIGAHIEKVLAQLDTHAILDQFFGAYRNEIVDRAYHQLRTTDHISRYRPGVIETTAQLAHHSQLEHAAQRLQARGDAPSVADALARLLEQTRAIRDQFEMLDALLELIDTRHSQFVDAAVRTVELQLMAQSTTSGQLHSILKLLLTNPTSEETFRTLTPPLVNLYELALVDSQSPAPPARAPTPFVPTIEAVEPLTPEELVATQLETLAQPARVISRDHVRKFVQEFLAGQHERRGAELNLERANDLPLLIYLRAYGNGGLGYVVEADDNG